MMSLSADKDAELIEAFNSKSRYFDDLLNIDNTYFDGMVKQIYTSEFQLKGGVDGIFPSQILREQVYKFGID